MEFLHLPVMEREVIEALRCGGGAVYVDGTVGGGGHAKAVLEASSPDGRLVGIDRDDDALDAARSALSGFGDRVTLVKANFREIRKVVEGLGIKGVDGVILDLGVSSFQFDAIDRGFSFRNEARLDMRMDRSQKLSAYDLVNGADFDELTRIFREYGEEREARRITRALLAARERRPIETTVELANLISLSVPRKLQSKGIHPATRVFQALRIAVNDELGSLKDGLSGSFDVLKGGGRLAVISFHSLEDRIVKVFFRGLATGCVCPPRFPQCVCGQRPRATLVTRKSITPSEEETGLNPRARSARLRVVEKI
ncbi:MAG: 16S rRNA (cytosine(1402)-N(4))-methyltransferase [Deltaproteobacteria bacterium GWC2_56_8]|nr:MAG: 16S rRNA (cytosine(1402)-N(4))-methyltransferase [Deltaproteobacteria bacterium GWB2_55_19]OGP38428.1 MAG: 16S rRNA (cytosine(1402)-N(4))-methyltransferase [Deltaproteobacteria bacterium GWC2_56_8]HAO94046.1 16S rRNA (cytosine(1402)-N(4))-methyltransferase [Deltaproteobacteria bacterium]